MFVQRSNALNVTATVGLWSILAHLLRSPGIRDISNQTTVLHPRLGKCKKKAFRIDSQTDFVDKRTCSPRTRTSDPYKIIVARYHDCKDMLAIDVRLHTLQKSEFILTLQFQIDEHDGR
jgi:hypothetical protein